VWRFSKQFELGVREGVVGAGKVFGSIF